MNTVSKSKASLKLGLLAIFCTILWGSAFPSVKLGYQLFAIASKDTGGQMLFAGYRFTLAGVITLFIATMAQKKIPIPKKEVIGPIAVLGLIQTTLQYIFFYVGMSNTTGVKGSILTASNSFFAILLAHFLIKGEKITSRKLMGCILGFIGVGIINYTPNGLGGGFALTGEGFLLLAGFSYALGSVYVKFFAHKEHVLTITAYQLLIGGVVLILAGIVSGGSITTISFKGGLLLGYMGFISSVAFSIWTWLLREYQVGRVSIYGFATPIFGVLLSAIFLGEDAFSLKNVIALLFVCGGIVVVNKQKSTLSLVKQR